jgi:hypothetical protein
MPRRNNKRSGRASRRAPVVTYQHLVDSSTDSSATVNASEINLPTNRMVRVVSVHAEFTHSTPQTAAAAQVMVYDAGSGQAIAWSTPRLAASGAINRVRLNVPYYPPQIYATGTLVCKLNVGGAGTVTANFVIKVEFGGQGTLGI